MSKLYGIGVGPGDSELITVKGVRAIENSDVIVAPTGTDGGESIALNTVKEYIKEGTEVFIMHFPMGGKDKRVKVRQAYDLIEEKLREGKTVSFLTIGDPFVYSTYIHLLKEMEEKKFEVVTVPGITSFCSAASIVGRTIVVGDNRLTVMPATKVHEITDEKYVVIMKVYKREEEVLNTLEEKGFNYTYVSRAGREGQIILEDKEEILKCRDYMSLILGSRE